MNKRLLKEIVWHIYSNFLIVPSDFIDPNSSLSLMDKEYLLDKKLVFQSDEGAGLSKNVWGCQLVTGNQKIKILCGDCSQDDTKEYALLISVKDAPVYGVYSCFNQNRLVDQEAMIAVSTKDSGWLECNTFLQATFLAGMEQMKELGLSWDKCQDHKEEFNLLKSFISYHDSVYGEDNAG